ncbi:hypothetical protein D9619_008384 [Psilocybe cf. subviscida]|uniref:Uncharacterized protein n=1 Tax=Psilocybe cf. subviscida TaxID=2480587 RepID=A0A8H5F0N9_9AGAR|nr:hypothetical protein D9619_008384 [Psilocybe cf. subviscida]
MLPRGYTGLYAKHPYSSRFPLACAISLSLLLLLSLTLCGVFPEPCPRILLMDPLSVTLAVVSLATAVKDIVEFGQKIHKSFAKVSNNLRNAQRVAGDIKEMVEDIRLFCEDHKDILEDMTDFGLALQGLHVKFQGFAASILPLLPQTGGGRQDRLIRGWAAWRNNNKIEGSILGLQSDVVKVIRIYIMKSSMRTEVGLARIHQDTSRGFTGVHYGMAQGFEVIRRHISALHITAATTTMSYLSHESLDTTSDEVNRNVTMFAQSTPSASTPMLRTPEAITEEVMTTAYIKFQVNVIVMTLENMSKQPISAPNSVSPSSHGIGEFDSSLPLEECSMSTKRLRYHVVRQITTIHDLLDTKHMQTISIYDGARRLNNLAVGLRELDMRHESILIGNWTITLMRTLADVSSSGQPNLVATLALCLLNQSSAYHNIGDNIQSLRAIEESYAITQNLRDQYSGDARFDELHSDVLLQYARYIDSERSIEMSVEAMLVMEGILDVQAFDESYETVVQPNSSFLDHLFSSAPTISSILTYALALKGLGFYLSTNEDPEISLDLALLSIAVYRKIVSVHGDQYKVYLANALAYLIELGIVGLIPAEELIDIVDECAQLFREMSGTNPLSYARELVNVMWVKATTLEKLNRDAEAIATWEEIARLAEQIVQDSELYSEALYSLSKQFRRLERHDEAVRTGTLAIAAYQDGEECNAQASGYYLLSQDLHHLRRYMESTEAARKSVELHRRLTIREPEKWAFSLNRSLFNLASCLVALMDYSEALIACKESVSILNNLLNTDTGPSSAVIEDSLLVLHYLTMIAGTLGDKEECLKVYSATVEHLHKLCKLHPQNGDIIVSLWRIDCDYVSNMLEAEQLQEAQQYIDRWLEVWNNKPEAISESSHATWCASMILLKSDILVAQGCTEQALLATQKVQGIVRTFISTDETCFCQMILSMLREAKLRSRLSDGREALRVAEEALRICRDTKLWPDMADELMQSLNTVASTALSCQNYERALEAAREGCISPEGLNHWQNRENLSSLYPSMLASLSFSEANLDRHGTAAEYAHRAVDASREIGEMKARISATTAEQSYMETRGNLAEILLATGNLAQAQQICEERSVYFSKRVEQRMGDYCDLAPILHMLGTLCCNEGRHEEGEAAAKELTRIMKMLGSAFPSLQDQVKIQLRRQTKVPILRILNDMSEKLDCGHQADVLSLFTA